MRISIKVVISSGWMEVGTDREGAAGSLGGGEKGCEYSHLGLRGGFQGANK